MANQSIYSLQGVVLQKILQAALRAFADEVSVDQGVA